MSAAPILFLALCAIVAGFTLWQFGRWLAGSWEVLDDDQLHDKLAGTAGSPHPYLWPRLTRWFGRGPRRLTYRRDKRGRFRRVRR